MSNNLQHPGHGHGHMDATGKGHGDPNDSGLGVSPAKIGAAFTPMAHTAPVLGMTTPHQKIQCNGCTAKTWWSPSLEVPPCAHCGGPLDPANIGN